MFAVSSVDAAKCYYEELNRLQKDNENSLKIATIFSFAANEEQNAVGEIPDETFELSAMDLSAKEFLTKAIVTTMQCLKQVIALIVKSFRTTIETLLNV